MSDKKNAIFGEIENIDDFDFDELEKSLENQIEDSFADLDFLEEDKKKIGNPESIGNAVIDVVWDQCIIQIGAVAGEDFIKENRGLRLDLRDEAHIQTTDNFANGKIATHNTEIDYQQRYDDWQSNFKKDENGNVIKKYDNRSGKEKEVLNKGARAAFDKDRPKGSAQEHMDHTVSAGEIIRDPAANAHMSKEEQIAFANSDKNLNPLDAAANESKGDSTMSEWLDSERNGEKPADRFDIDEEKLREKDKEAREEFEKQKKEAEEKSIAAGKKSQKEEAFRIGGKALRAAIMGLLAELIRNIISKLVVWLKSSEKSIKTFIGQVKDAISSFLKNIKQNLLTAGTTMSSTVLSAIFGPVVSAIQKVFAIIKQGAKSVKEAIDYVKNPANRNKSFGELMLEVGKIVMAGITATGALVLGEVIEKALLGFPAFAIQIPLLGSLANIIGIFLGAIVAGIAGALIINLIDKLIAKNKKREITEQQITRGNEIINAQGQLIDVYKEHLYIKEEQTIESIKSNHEKAGKITKEALDNISKNLNLPDHEDFLNSVKKALE